MTPSAYFQAGEARMRLKEYVQALEHFSKAVSAAKSPSDIHASSLLRRAECEALLDKWKQSQATAQQFLGTYNKHELTPRGHFTLGWAMENQKQYTKAIESYRVVTAGGKNDALTARAQFQIGECLFASNKLDEAVKELVKVESKYSFPEWSAKAILELGRVREAQDMEDEAMARYKEVITRFPNTTAATVAKNLLKKLD
jgi:TolA-binding protein